LYLAATLSGIGIVDCTYSVS